MKINLPWPPAGLSPNARMHWSALARLKKKYREECYYSAIEQGAYLMRADALHVSLTFYPPTRREYDLDNALARLKSGIDGLADALRVDDKKWSFDIKKGDGVGGFVEVLIGSKND